MRDRILLAQTGEEPVLRDAIAYLEGLGIPLHLIQGVSMYSTVGEPITMTVTLVVGREDGSA